jgi:hypothetical protein
LDSVGPSEGPGPGSSPGRATCDNRRGMNFATFNRHGQVVASKPCECDGRTVVFGTTRRGSTPWRGTRERLKAVRRRLPEELRSPTAYSLQPTA